MSAVAVAGKKYKIKALYDLGGRIYSFSPVGGTLTFGNNENVIRELESFIPNVEEIISRMRSPKKIIEATVILNKARRELPGLVQLWKNYDVQKAALVRIYDYLGDCLFNAPPPIRHENGLLPNMDNFYQFLMYEKGISEAQARRAVELAKNIYSPIAKFNPNSQAKFDELIVEFEILTLFVDI